MKGHDYMTGDSMDIAALQRREQQHHDIEDTITRMFAPEDEGLRSALAAGKEAGLPAIQISPIQGKFLQLLAKACGARKILEIGSLAGYSGIWLAKALPSHGRLISLEVSPKHAEVIRGSFARAGIGDRSEVRVGKALDLLPELTGEAPFDLIFIDADKPAYPAYLDWALRLSRPGSIIVADNCIRRGAALTGISEDEGTRALAHYNQLTIDNPRLTSLALAIDSDYLDGFNIAVVQSEE
jgi:predicted O-methyltransferase YrrM